MLQELERAVEGTKAAVRAVVERVDRQGMDAYPRTKPGRILLFGEGSSLHVAKLAYWMLKRDRGRPRPSVTAVPSTGLGNEVFPGPEDWAFGISHRGKTAATLNALKICSRGEAFTTLVTAAPVPEGMDPATDVAQYRLLTGDLETIEPHTFSLLTSLAAITTLLGGARFADQWLKWCGESDSEFQHQADFWPQDWNSLWLGQWEGEWLACEAQLKQVEMARSISWAMGSEAFFHGPAASLDLMRQRMAWFRVPGDRREQELAMLPGLASFQLTDPRTDLLSSARGLRGLHLWTLGMLRARTKAEAPSA